MNLRVSAITTILATIVFILHVSNTAVRVHIMDVVVEVIDIKVVVETQTSIPASFFIYIGVIIPPQRRTDRGNILVYPGCVAALL
jgi:hypothetical protein